jgi:HK97 family phage portal protein
MKLLGFDISRTRTKDLVPVSDNRGWISLIGESFPGAWQRNISIDRNLSVSYFAVFACMTLISGDISKLRLKFMRKRKDIWEESNSPAYDPVLRKPNQMQTSNQFWESWILSKLIHGNTYAIKRRDERNVVNRLIILDPNRVKILVSESGDVWYQLNSDNVAGILPETITLPASEIIHDRMNCMFHPLVGLSPLFAAGLAAMQGLNIQNESTRFFGNRSVPGGIITSPNTIPDSTAKRLKEAWESKASMDNSGRTMVLGDGLEFKAMAMSAGEAQLIEQLKWTAENVCSCFHVPPYKVGVGPMPSYNNVQALNLEYYTQCLQVLIEAAEASLDLGLEMKSGTKVEFDLEGLLRMDTKAQTETIQLAIGSGAMSPNEARKKLDLPPVPGGENCYLQQQNFSLEALAKRDQKPDPFGTDKPVVAPAAPKPAAKKKERKDDGGERNRAFFKGLLNASA